MRERPAAPYWSPYAAGFGLGLTLLAAFVIAGQGLGASGAFARLTAWLASIVAPTFAAANESFSHYVGNAAHPLANWLVFEVLGVAAGGLLSAALAGRIATRVERGPRATRGRRLVFAIGGGVLSGFAARLALGCTSGQALSGGAMLSAGAWIFMLSVFAGGYGAAWFVRRQWQ